MIVEDLQLWNIFFFLSIKAASHFYLSDLLTEMETDRFLSAVICYLFNNTSDSE